MQRFEAALASSRAQLAQAQANLLQSQKSYERTAQIKKANPQLISDENLEQLRTSVEVNESRVTYRIASQGLLFPESEL